MAGNQDLPGPHRLCQAIYQGDYHKQRKKTETKPPCFQENAHIEAVRRIVKYLLGLPWSDTQWVIQCHVQPCSLCTETVEA